MTAKDLIKANLGMSDFIVNAYLDEMSDADLHVVSVEGMKPIAWQMGHLLVSEHGMVQQLKEGAAAPLPAGYQELFERKGAPATGSFPSKDEILAAWKNQREATLKLVDELPESELDAATGVEYAPTKGLMLHMIGTHIMMHVGQWVAVRRKLGKKVAI